MTQDEKYIGQCIKLADKAAAAQVVKEKKINYGGLPGTKPRKRK